MDMFEVSYLITSFREIITKQAKWLWQANHQRKLQILTLRSVSQVNYVMFYVCTMFALKV